MVLVSLQRIKKHQGRQSPHLSSPNPSIVLQQELDMIKSDFALLGAQSAAKDTMFSKQRLFEIVQERI